MKCPIYEHKGIKIYSFIMPITNSNMYVLIGKGKQALVFDPNISEDALLLLNEYGVENIDILLTHEHYDHISGVNFLREYIKIEVLCSKKCAQNIKNSAKNLSKFSTVIHPELSESQLGDLNQDYECYADKILNDGDSISWENMNILCREAPGHSEGGCLFILDEQLLFSGDNLTNGDGVIERWPGGSAKKYVEITRPLIENMSDNTLVFPGHGDIARLSELKKYLDFYRR